MANNNLKKWLAGRKETAQQEVEQGKERKGLAELPDGTYIAVYTKHEMGTDKNDDNGIKTCWRVLEGEHAGEDVWTWENMDRESAFEWLTVRLKNSGIEIEDANDIFEQMESNPTDLFDLCENRVVVKLRLNTTKSKDGREFQNKNVQKALPDYDVDESMLGNSASTKTAPAAQEVTPTAEEEGEAELAVGMTIKFKKGRTELVGEITSLNSEDEIAVVKDADGKEHEVGSDAILEIVNAETV